MAEPNVKRRTLLTGDNPDVLRGMNSESAELLYCDPPFHTNRHDEAPIGSEAAGAALQDTWTLSDVDRAWLGWIAERGPALASIIDAVGLAHGKGMQTELVMRAVRLLEMKRLLKPTGSLYCDPAASHYLKLVMDAILEPQNSRNEIHWKRYGAHNDVGQGSRHFGLPGTFPPDSVAEHFGI